LAICLEPEDSAGRQRSAARSSTRHKEARMRKAIRLTTLFVVAILLSIVAGSSDAPGAKGCSNASLRGSYGLHATGTILNVGPFAAVGVFTFDGDGHLSGTLTSRVNANTFPRERLTGTYDVTPDCFVSDTWNFESGETTQHESVVVDNGRGYFILNTTAGVPNVISGVARKQSSEFERDE
jgi:hypothetical protein